MIPHEQGPPSGRGRCPSGNTSGRMKITGRIPRSHPKLFMSPRNTTNAPVRPRVTSHVKSSPARKLAAAKSAAYRSIRPITFRRSRLTITEPTTPNIVNATM